MTNLVQRRTICHVAPNLIKTSRFRQLMAVACYFNGIFQHHTSSKNLTKTNLLNIACFNINKYVVAVPRWCLIWVYTVWSLNKKTISEE